MITILFATVNAGGNLPPEVGIGAELQRRGHSVRFLGHPGQRSAVERSGLAFGAYPSGADYDPTLERSTLRGLRELTGVFADPRITADVIAAARRDRADVLVVDCLLTGPLQEVTRAGLPVVSLVHTFWEFFERMTAGPVGGVLRLRGVHARAALTAPALSIVTARRDLDPAGSVPPAVRHVGAVWQGIPTQAATGAGRPRILVSLSTTWFPGQEQTLQAILDAVAALPVDAVVTTGPAVPPGRLRVPRNAEVHSWLDHGPELARASLVVGHGGHSTLMRALSHGVPVLVLPMHPMLDQPMVGAAASRNGVGRSLSRKASPETIGAAITAMLGDPALTAAARRMGEDIRRADGAVVAADLVEQFAAGRRAGGEEPVSPR
ncbi:MAG: hypothetical protein JWR33_2033 [Naasia sp.]|uniref:glycosyltransferase n=1 Tax=Naasia sp. TaxID=2546198 RepID=UPI002631871A|nr:nucleotide disphospho-sugar-binding domain-containing protein [Naasia sp.]MCU1571292.1 hypothetical protein [Naasia sp.]